MRKVALLSVRLCLWLGLALQSRAQDDEARGLIEKAIKAHGGAEKLSAVKAVQMKAKGKANVMNMEFPFTMEMSIQRPDKVKVAMDLDINNMNISFTQVYNGKKGWINILGKTQEMDEKTLKEA